MVTTLERPSEQRDRLRRTTSLVACYVTVSIATIVALAVLSASGSTAATSHAWGHAIIVGVFALLLPIRLHAARRGSAGALRAVGIIATVLLVVNAVEAALAFFPGWMRVEMVGIALLSLAIVVSVVRARR